MLQEIQSASSFFTPQVVMVTAIIKKFQDFTTFHYFPTFPQLLLSDYRIVFIFTNFDAQSQFRLTSQVNTVTCVTLGYVSLFQNLFNKSCLWVNEHNGKHINVTLSVTDHFGCRPQHHRADLHQINQS